MTYYSPITIFNNYETRLRNPRQKHHYQIVNIKAQKLVNCLVRDAITYLLVPTSVFFNLSKSKNMSAWRSCMLALAATAAIKVQSFGVQSPSQKCVSSPSALFNMEPILAPFENEGDHLKNQAAAFDGMATMFSRSDGLPEDTAAVVDHIAITFLREIVETRRQGAKDRGEEVPTKFRLLDIGCGAGVLVRFFLNEANKMGVTLDIVGVDVSDQMITFGKGHATNVLKDVGTQHSIDMVCDDFIKYLEGEDGDFDGVIANSCFANFFDTNASIKAMTDGIREDGIVCVAHPVGSAFVQGLHEMNPLVTPHLMPTESEFSEMTSPYSLKIQKFYEKLEWKQRKLPLYYASAVKVALD
jgi:SAM-dependent methyltransferase